MRRKITVYGLRFSKTSFWNRLNTGFPDPAVATVLTACGIETKVHILKWFLLSLNRCNSTYRLRYWNKISVFNNTLNSQKVATVLTACGIETKWCPVSTNTQMQVATVLTACGIETKYRNNISIKSYLVATVLTACGIETLLKKVS